MTKATSVLSTPRTVAPATRRQFFTQAAAVGIGAAAMLPVEPVIAAATAAATTASLANPDADPIHAAIAKHKAAMLPWEAAVAVRADFPDGPHRMTVEQREELWRLDDAQDEARQQLDQTGDDLISTAPTTPAGVVAAIQYLRTQMRDDGTFMPQTYLLDTGGDAQCTMGWIDAWLNTIATAAESLRDQFA